MKDKALRLFGILGAIFAVAIAGGASLQGF
jgi:hypothetical protein